MVGICLPRQFGSGILFATEGFKSFNAVIIQKSRDSNRLAPSQDIALASAHGNCLLGGASIGVRATMARSVAIDISSTRYRYIVYTLSIQRECNLHNSEKRVLPRNNRKKKNDNKFKTRPYRHHTNGFADRSIHFFPNHVLLPLHHQLQPTREFSTGGSGRSVKISYLSCWLCCRC